MDALTVLNILLALVNLAVGAYQLRKEWQTRHAPTTPHPLEATLRTLDATAQNIAEAIRALDRARAPRTRRPPAP